MKSYAQALGVQQTQNQEQQNKETIDLSNENKEQGVKKPIRNNESTPLLETIETLKKQTLQLTDLVKTLTETVVTNEEKQTETFEIIERINNSEPTTSQESAQK